MNSAARRSRCRPLVVATMLVALLVGGCSVPSSGGAGTGDGTAAAGGSRSLRLVESTEPESLNPLVYLFGITARFYDGLFAITENGGTTPQLAVAAATSHDDATRWTVEVRDDVTFSDGSPLTADDVAATYDAIIDPSVGSPLASTFSVLKSVAVDGPTVTFTMKQAYAGFDQLLTVGVGKRDSIRQPLDASSLNTQPLGSGPYVLDSWRRGESMTLKKNPHYWQETPKVEQLTVSFVSDQSAIAQRLAGGEFDGAQLPPSLARTFEKDPDVTVWTNPSADFRGVSLPREGPGLQDSRVRTALNLAVDRQAMVDGVLFGYGEQASQPYTQAQGDFFEPKATFAYDPTRATELLDAAGWRTVEEHREKDGQTLGFTLMYFPEDQLRRDLSLAFASDMKKIGVTVQVEAVGRDTFGSRMIKDAALFGGGDMPYDPDQQGYSLLYGGYADFDAHDPYRNPSGYDNPAVDKALTEGRSSTDHQQRVAAYRRVQTEYVKDPAMVVLVVLEHTYVARHLDEWSGIEHVVEPHEHGVAWGPWWNVATWQPK